jgi:hypothetical protein
VACWQFRECVKGSNIASASSSAFAINALTANFGVVTMTAIPKKSVWTKPSLGFYKLNVDASFFPDVTEGAGAVLRNSRGEVLAGSYSSTTIERFRIFGEIGMQ